MVYVVCAVLRPPESLLEVSGYKFGERDGRRFRDADLLEAAQNMTRRCQNQFTPGACEWRDDSRCIRSMTHVYWP